MLACSLPCSAAPKWLTAVPRAVGRTSKTMAMPWTDPQGAIRDYVIIGAVFADAAETRRALIRNPNTYETSPLLGRHPSAGRYWLEMAPLAIGEATWTTWGAETTTGHDPDNKWWNAWSYAVPWVTMGAFASMHAFNAYESAQIPAAHTTACLDPDHDCERAPDRD